jgi:hypothetical protein
MEEFDRQTMRPTAGEAGSAKHAVTRADRFSLRLAQDTGIIHSEVVGYWDVDDTVAYIEAMKSLVLKCRAFHGGARLLVDRSASQVQSLKVSEMLRDLNEFLGPNDRLAMIVNSTLTKMQLDRITVHGNTTALTSHAAALAWLVAKR